MSNNLKKVFTYLRMSLLFMILASIILYFAGAPVASYVTAKTKMIIENGAPKHQGGKLQKLEPIVNINGTMDSSEIQKPEINSQYGTIFCERIALTAPIYYGDSDTILEKGVGQYSLSGLPGEGKPILIGGHDITYFAPLEEILVGDIVNIATTYGEEYSYKVTDTKVAAATDTTAYDLSQDKEQLILYTCYPFGKLTGDRSNRYFVYCNKVADITEAIQ